MERRVGPDRYANNDHYRYISSCSWKEELAQTDMQIMIIIGKTKHLLIFIFILQHSQSFGQITIWQIMIIIGKTKHLLILILQHSQSFGQPSTRLYQNPAPKLACALLSL